MSLCAHFSKFGRPPVPDVLCKVSAARYPRFWRRFLNVFTIYGHGGHLGQGTVTILAIFRSPNLRRLHVKFEQNWLRRFRGGRLKMLTEARMEARMEARTNGRRTKSDHYSSS